jgi:predicted ATPase
MARVTRPSPGQGDSGQPLLTWAFANRAGFFLRTESYDRVASEIERLDQDPGSPPLLTDDHGEIVTATRRQ